MKNFTVKKSHKSFGGESVYCSYRSSITKTQMNFSYYRPSADSIDHVIVWLSGLTCTEENFMAKAGAQLHLSGTNTMIVCPDTSPRDLNLPGEHDSYDFGSGAGFYLNATTLDYCENYRMYDFIIHELLPIIKDEFSPKSISISGHSMGGHGALVLGLRNPELFSAISAFSPIVNPINCPWGQKAFLGYLGDNQENWKQYDSCELIKNGYKHPKKILIDQGLGDEFFKEQLLTENFEKVCLEFGQELQINYREGYDHSYYFIASFIGDHIKYLTT